MGRYLFFWSSVGSVMAMAPVAAWAQDERPVSYEPAQNEAGASEIQDIVVTANRREQSLMSVPVAVSALSSEDLVQRGITQSSELSAAVPSLQVNSAFGDTQPNFTLRGLGVGNAYGGNYASPVGVYTDDNYLAARTMHGMQLYDLERVEVLRGPQGTLYGRNTTGGAINFISVRPSLSGDRGFVNLGYGRFNELRGQGAVEGTLIDGVLGFRASVNYVHSDGYMKNAQAGQPDLNSQDSLAGRLIVRFNPADDLDVVLKITGAKSKPTQAGVHHIGLGANGENTLFGYSRAAENFGFWETRHPRVGYNDVDSFGAQLNITYNLTDTLTVSTLTAFDKANQVLSQEATATEIYRLLDTSYGNKYNQFNQELRFTYSNDSLNLQFGGYYGYDRVRKHDNYWLLDFLFVEQEFTQTRKSAAVFGQIDYDLTSRLGVTAGLRYTEDRAAYRDGYAFLAGDDTFNPAAATFTIGSFVPGTGIVPRPGVRNKNSAVTGRAGLNYKFDAGQMIYVNYSRGYRSGVYSNMGYLDGVVDYAKPEQVDAYEIGAKGRFFDGALRLSAAAYLTKYRNQQLEEIVGAAGYLRTAGRSTIKGFELEANAQIADFLRLNGSFTLMDAKYDQLTLSGVVLNGNKMPFAPSTMANLGAEIRLGEIGTGKVTFSPDLTYSSRIWFSPFNDLNGNGKLTQGANAKVNASLAWESDKLTLRLWANNILNRKTYMYGLNLRDSWGYDYLLPAAPATYGISARYNF